MSTDTALEGAAPPEPAAAPETTPPEPTAPTPEPTEPTPAPAEPTTDPDADNRTIFDLADEAGIGQSLRQKYRDDPWSALQGLFEGYRSIGERNEKAQKWQTFVETVGADKADQLLSGQPSPETPPAADLPSQEDLKVLVAAAQLPDAPPELKRRVEAIQQTLYDQQRQLPETLEAKLAAMEKRLADLGQQLQQTQQMGVAQQFRAQNHAEFVDAAGQPTPLGKSFDRIFNTHPLLQRLEPSDPHRSETAYELAKAQGTKVQKTRNIKDTARHEPSVQQPGLNQAQWDKLLEKHGDDLDALLAAAHGLTG